MKRFEDIDAFTVFVISWLFGLASGIALVEFLWLASGR